jgi:hypothetical protein
MSEEQTPKKTELSYHLLIWIICIFISGVSAGFVGGITIGKQKQMITETIDTHINLIMPKNEKELRKQTLFNACQQTMINEIAKWELFKQTTPPQTPPAKVEPKGGAKRDRQN